MAYTTANLVRIAGANSAGGSHWSYKHTDTIATVTAADYFSDGYLRALKVGDIIWVQDSTNVQNIKCIVTVVTDGGAATVANPEISTSGVVSGTGATATLTAAQSGKTILFDRAAGIVFTLPTPQVGLRYRFMTTVDLTSNAYQIGSGGAAIFFVGAIDGAIEGAATGETHFANGTTHVTISSNKTTTGGLIGGWIEVEGLSSTLWGVKGVLSCTATPATPFAA